MPYSESKCRNHKYPEFGDRAFVGRCIDRDRPSSRHEQLHSFRFAPDQLVHDMEPVSYTHLRAHETVLDIVCRLLLEKKKKNINITRLRTYTVITVRRMYRKTRQHVD